MSDPCFPDYGDPSRTTQVTLAKMITLLLRTNPPLPSAQEAMSKFLDTIIRDEKIGELLKKKSMPIQYQRGTILLLARQILEPGKVIIPSYELEQYKPGVCYPLDGQPFCGFYVFELRTNNTGILTPRRVVYPVDKEVMAAILCANSHAIGKIVDGVGPFILYGTHGPSHTFTSQSIALTPQQVLAGFQKAQELGPQEGFFSYDYTAPRAPVTWTTPTSQPESPFPAGQAQ
ncbi:MAG TPA: hypothetical protein VJJ82_01505 [Candidatus Nanoarchaeia archaeon]|nr:hypothetical protein [Candidatus Nanoarchaeia archaeon]